jgi:hypothetical protein
MPVPSLGEPLQTWASASGLDGRDARRSTRTNILYSLPSTNKKGETLNLPGSAHICLGLLLLV